MGHARLIKAQDVSDEMWAQARRLRYGRALYNSPFYDPDLTRLLAGLREDVRVIIREDKEGALDVFWPLHQASGKWSRGLGGPFSDRNGPLIANGETVDVSAVLQDAGLRGQTTHGFSYDACISGANLDWTPNYLVDLAQGWDAFYETQRSANARQFKKLRRQRRKLDSEHQDVAFVFDDKRPERF